jgi:hypothetical protein
MPSDLPKPSQSFIMTHPGVIGRIERETGCKEILLTLSGKPSTLLKLPLLSTPLTRCARSPGVQSGVESTDAKGVLMRSLLILDVASNDFDGCAAAGRREIRR